MGADKVIFSVRYAERNESKDWDRLKVEVAEFVAGIFFNWSPENSFANVLKLKQRDEKAVDWLGGGRFDLNYVFSENTEKRFCEIMDDDFTGGMDLVCMNIKNGLPKYYPEIDWEFHYYERYGEVYDQVIVSVGGKQYSGAYEVLLSPDEELLEIEYEEWNEDGGEGAPPPKTVDEWYESVDFSIPQPTTDNPYPIPKYVLDDYDAGDKIYYWACDQFQGKVEIVPHNTWYNSNIADKSVHEEYAYNRPPDWVDKTAAKLDASKCAFCDKKLNPEDAIKKRTPDGEVCVVCRHCCEEYDLSDWETVTE